MMDGYEENLEGFHDTPPHSETNAVQVLLVSPAPPAPTKTTNALAVKKKPNKPKMAKKPVDEHTKKQFPWREAITYVDTLVHLVHKHTPFAAKHGSTAQKWDEVAFLFNIEFKIIELNGELRKQVMNVGNPSGSLH